MDDLLSLYRQLYRIRRAEEVIADLYHEQQMRCPTHLCIGQEGVAVGVCAELRPQDVVFGTHRSHGYYLAKGASMAGMFAELYGKETGCSRGKGGSMHLIDMSVGFLGAAPILGATISGAVGAAWGYQMRGEPHIATAFFGDGATEEGIFYECVNFAALKKAPVLMVCENNRLSTCSPLSVRQPFGRTIAQLVRGIGVPGEMGDGNDVLEVQRLARKALAHIRSGAGPYFLEFSTYRWREHCGPNYDFDLGYRDASELTRFQAECPLARLEMQLGAYDERTQLVLSSIRDEVETEIDAAVRFAKESPFPESHRLLEDVYVT